jgi:tight adherence protein C
MPPIVILAAVAVAASVPLLWWSLAGQRHALSATTNLLLGMPDRARDPLPRSRGGEERAHATHPLLVAPARLVRRATPEGLLTGLDRRLTRAGRPVAWSLERVLAAKLLLSVATLVVGSATVVRQPRAGMVVLWLAAAGLAYVAPDLLLISRAQERRKAIGHALPDTLDQMSIAVEAGLGFDAAMARAGQTGTGPLADELVRTLQEIQVGVARSTAMRNLADRTDQADLRHFVLAAVQAENYGIPIADVLRTQAAEQRVKRRQRAEEQALKIPVKIIFPLILCILPTLFIVILGPAAIQISRTLFGAGGVL